jgi:monoamine oxidase
VRLTTAKGEHAGSHAIVTVPLGVLKAGSIEFVPPLPAAKLAAIERLDMGNLEKVVLRFDAAFWTDLDDPRLFYIARQPGELAAFFDATKLAGAPAIVCLYGGQSARDVLDARSDAEVAAGALAALGELLGREVPQPLAVRVTRWWHDPFARGSYSYVPVGASAADMRALGAPVGERLLFAGEATEPTTYATVHAALISGLREARRIGGPELTLPGME